MDIFVSVAVCTYNRPASLRESLNAILNQTFNNYELILKWNRSLRFSLAVCTLKDKFKNEL